MSYQNNIKKGFDMGVDLFSVLKIIKDGLNVLEKFRGASEFRKKERKEYHTDFIEPLYSGIRSIHKYYVDLLKKTVTYIEEGNVDARKIIDNLEKEIHFNSSERAESNFSISGGSDLRLEKTLALIALLYILYSHGDYLRSNQTEYT